MYLIVSLSFIKSYLSRLRGIIALRRPFVIVLLARGWTLRCCISLISFFSTTVKTIICFHIYSNLIQFNKIFSFSLRVGSRKPHFATPSSWICLRTSDDLGTDGCSPVGWSDGATAHGDGLLRPISCSGRDRGRRGGAR